MLTTKRCSVVGRVTLAAVGLLMWINRWRSVSQSRYYPAYTVLPSPFALPVKEGIPHPPKDRQTVTEKKSRRGDRLKQAGKSFSFRSFPLASWSERALRTR